MQVGDIKYYQIGGEIVEHIVTQEEVNAYEAQQVESQKQAILTELEKLDNIVSREYENTYEAFEKLKEQGIITENPLYIDDFKISKINEKKELRAKL